MILVRGYMVSHIDLRIPKAFKLDGGIFIPERST